MHIVECDSKNYKLYLKFVSSIYKNNRFYKDTTSSLLKALLLKQSIFCKHAYTYPIMIYDNKQVVAVCTFIHADNYQETLQIAYFEALPDYDEAVNLILTFGKKLCKDRNISKMTIGLSGHVNYGLGILVDHYDVSVSFGNNYNPPYYIDYFEKYKTADYKLTSFSGTMNALNLNLEPKMIRRVSSNFTFRSINFKDFRNEMKIYTDLNNRCFLDHPFYFKRSYEEDYELFKDLKLFMKEENLIFVEKEGQPIGFMLWYPDYNELIPPGKSIGVGTFIKNKLFAGKIKKCKIVEIGILPEFHNTGAILGLFNACYQRTKDKYALYESSWILDTNFKSKNFGTRWAGQEYKHYKVYEIEL
ncbi:hypothetical protein [Cellulosilyticum sp. I15G10I2]|uniref:hypothetical protein n=1 Tax=Cellulosilyticum sp. I15G10I2 TaxID=1892843 RepID=UPI00085BBCE5|nr:hypothetical protein [Cellulosilyticum sp. I15G10I2]